MGSVDEPATLMDLSSRPTARSQLNVIVREVCLELERQFHVEELSDWLIRL